MRIHLKFVVSVLTVLVAGCGPAENLDDERLQTLRVQAEPYINYMNYECHAIIVPFAIRAGRLGFPEGIRATKVKLVKSDGTTWAWRTDVDTHLRPMCISEDKWISAIACPNGTAGPGYFEEVVLRGVARGCGPGDIREGDAVAALVTVEVGSMQVEVATSTTVSAAW